MFDTVVRIAADVFAGIAFVSSDLFPGFWMNGCNILSFIWNILQYSKNAMGLVCNFWSSALKIIPNIFEKILSLSLHSGGAG